MSLMSGSTGSSRSLPRDIAELRALAERQPELAPAARLQIELVESQRRVQGRLSDAVALWFVGLAVGLSSAFLLAQMIHSEGRRPARVLGWAGRNRAVLATVYAVGITVIISLAVAGAAIAIRDPLVRTGVDDLLRRFADWRASVL